MKRRHRRFNFPVKQTRPFAPLVRLCPKYIPLGFYTRILCVQTHTINDVGDQLLERYLVYSPGKSKICRSEFLFHLLYNFILNKSY